MRSPCLSVLGLLLSVLSVSTLFAQSPAIPTNHLAWDQAAPTLAEEQAYDYRYYVDGAVVGVVLVGVTCSGTTTPFVCVVPFPAFTPGSHTLTVTAHNLAGESAPSAPLTFVFIVVPGAPTNLRIQ